MSAKPNIGEVFLVETKTRMSMIKWPQVAMVLIALCVSFVIGLLIGHFAIRSSVAGPSEAHNSPAGQVSSPGSSAKQEAIDRAQYRKVLFANIDNQRIKVTHKDLSSRTSLSGSIEDYELALKLKLMWQNAGLDSVRIQRYDIQLGYPNVSRPNRVSVLAQNGSVLYSTAVRETPRRDGDPTGDFLQPYLIYCKPGVVTADPVFVNYCLLKDFQDLMSLGVSVAGKIVLCKYGRGSRARKLLLAEKFGAIGVVITHDGADDAPLGDQPSQVYPNTQYLPPDGVQRGSVSLKLGDPETPFMPSLANAYRNSPEEQAKMMPGIPAQPISYRDGGVLLSLLGNQPMPANWTFGYADSNRLLKIGPGFADPSLKLRLEVYNSVERRPIYNVIGVINGWQEPDRFVMVGNHKDSWVLGAVDAKSGTATVMELVRAFGELKKSGWRPRRTLVFGEWSGEEQGLIGSTEFNDEFRRQMEAGGVFYLNLDIACMGGYLFEAGGSPLIRQLAQEAARNTPNPNAREVAAGFKTIYDVWLSRQNETLLQNDLVTPAGGRRSGGSDFAPFAFLSGVPFYDLTYDNQYLGKNNESLARGLYPNYHTSFDTQYLVSTFQDPEFKYHQAVARIAAWMLHSVVDDPILPFTLRYYAAEVNAAYKSLGTRYGSFVSNYSAALSRAYRQLGEAVDTFRDLGLSFDQYLWQLRSKDTISDLDRREINDVLQNFERHFIVTKSHLGSSPSFALAAAETHMILQGSQFNSGKYVLAPLADALFLFIQSVEARAKGEKTVGEYLELAVSEDDVLRYFALTTYTIESATRSFRHEPIDRITHQL